MKKSITKIIFLLIISICLLPNDSMAYRKCLWVWNTSNIMGGLTEENRLINECINTQITDVYLYCPSELLNTPSDQTEFQSFISRMSCKGIRIWAMDGWRGYFSDLCGPDDYYASIQNIIDYNAASASNEKFFGFHGDNEFQETETSSGCGPGTAFHYGKKDVNLSTTSGSGVWQDTEKQDRDSLMADYVKQAYTAASMCHDAGMQYGVAIMPWIPAGSWTHNAIGQQTTPLYAKFNGVNKPLFKHILDYVDEYVIMSYHTNVQSKVTLMCEDVLTYADGLSVSVRPRIFSALETYCGVAQYVSYCDTPGEDNKEHVESEIDLHESLMGTHASYTGVAIHDWTGWKNLATSASNSSGSTNTSTPSYSNCTTTGIEKSIEESGISIAPNPGKDQLVIKLQKEKSIISSVKMFDAMGNLVYNNSSVSLNDLEINTEEFVSGIYFIDLGGYKVKWIKN